MMSNKSTINPKGLNNRACWKLPVRIDVTDLVTPHEGQGIPVIFLKRQTGDNKNLPTISFTNTQKYPARETERMRKYNFLCVKMVTLPVIIFGN